MAGLFVLLQRLLPQHLLSRIVAVVANAEVRAVRLPLIHLFIRVFGVDLDEAEPGSAADYRCFNEFFTRQLKAGSRPVSGHISSPADGSVSMAGALQGNQLLQAKGMSYSLEKLLATPDVSRFRDGSYFTVYLAPRDYHRVHLPITARLHRTRYVPGRLFSVNGSTTAKVPDLFAINERLVMEFDSEIGPMAMVMVGAMIVAGIRPVWRDTVYSPHVPVMETFPEPQQFDQGAEIGRFEMGSTVVLLFGNAQTWCVDAGESIRMGQAIAE